MGHFPVRKLLVMFTRPGIIFYQHHPYNEHFSSAFLVISPAQTKKGTSGRLGAAGMGKTMANHG